MIVLGCSGVLWMRIDEPSEVVGGDVAETAEGCIAHLPLLRHLHCTGCVQNLRPEPTSVLTGKHTVVRIPLRLAGYGELVARLQSTQIKHKDSNQGSQGSACY